MPYRDDLRGVVYGDKKDIIHDIVLFQYLCMIFCNNGAVKKALLSPLTPRGYLRYLLNLCPLPSRRETGDVYCGSDWLVCG